MHIVPTDLMIDHWVVVGLYAHGNGLAGLLHSKRTRAACAQPNRADRRQLAPVGVPL